jgi:hypothetical protein
LQFCLRFCYIAQEYISAALSLSMLYAKLLFKICSNTEGVAEVQLGSSSTAIAVEDCFFGIRVSET